ncbi:MAG: cardiolipin synthase, partial [Prevotella sp.]|nr:cardiolipin synthase [Prevotella sp.]
MRTLPLLITLHLSLFTFAQAQTVDSLVVNDLRHEGVTFSRNNSVTLFTTGQAKFDDMFEAIRQARSSIHLEYFNFRNDSIATLLFDLLAMKAQQGVEIRALYDAFGNASNNRPLKKHHINSLRRRGIEIYSFAPMRFPWITYALSRDHRKIVIIDGLIAYTGGMNVADYYINGTEQVGEWHDMHCRIEGEEVNTLQDIFLRIWNKTTKQSIHGAKYFHGGEDTCQFINLTADPCDEAGQEMVGIVNREPQRSNQIIRTFYTSAINHAHDSIKLINPYFTLIRPIKRALRDAAQRGVKVEIMLSTRSDIPLSPDCGFYNA